MKGRYRSRTGLFLQPAHAKTILGSLLLFAMLATRRVNWYQIGNAGAVAPPL